MRRWRERICAHADLIVTPSAAILPPATPAQKILELEWGADTDRFHPGAAGELPFAPSRRHRRGLRRGVPQLARRRAPGDRASRAARPRAPRRRRGVHRRRPGTSARARGGRAGSRASSSPAPCRTRDARVPRGVRHRRRAVRHRRARAARARLLLVAAEDLRIHGRRASRRRAGRGPDSDAGRARPRGAAVSAGRSRSARVRAGAADRRAAARPLGAAARDRAVREYSWAAHCRALDDRLAPGRAEIGRDEHPRSRPTRSRRSAAAAAGARTSWRAACARADTPSRSSSRVRARRPACARRRYDGFRVLEFGAPAPPIPYVRNYFKNERLYATLADFLADVIARERIDLVHGQHVLTCVPSVEAARRAAIPVVCTVRDYWPVCYWSDLIHTNDRRGALPGMLGGDDDAVRPAARRRALAGGAPDDSVHAREPGAQTPRPRRGGCDRGRQLHDRRAICARGRRRSPARGSRSFRIP